MSEIVKFPERPDAAKRREAHEEERQRKAQAEARAKEQRSAHIERAQAAMKSRPIMKTESERRTVARNLWLLLASIEKGPDGISKAEVLKAAGKAAAGDSTKHLARYALPPGLPEAEELKRTGQLVQKIRIYVAIAKKAAELAKRDPDDALLQLLQGSSYLAEELAAASDDPTWLAAEHIAEHIRRAADRLSRHHDLPAFFATLRRHRLVWQAQDGEEPELYGKWVVDPGVRSSRATLPCRVEGPGDLADVERCPAIHLGIVRADESTKHGVFQGTYSHTGYNFGVTAIAEAVPVWEVSLVLGPFGPDGAVVPFLALREKTWVAVASDDLYDQVFADPMLCGISGEHHGFKSAGRVALARERLCFGDDHPLTVEDSSILYRDTLDDARMAAHALRRDERAPPDSDLALPENPAGPPHIAGVDPLELDLSSADAAALLRLPVDRPRPSAELLAVSTETMRRILARERLVRHMNANGREAIVWTDERIDGSFNASGYPFDYSLRSDPLDVNLTNAPEGTLLALIERWVTAKPADSDGPIAALGTLGRKFRQPLWAIAGLDEADRKRLPLPTPASGLERVLDRAVHNAVTRIDVMMDKARNRLREAAHSEPAVAVAPLAETSSTPEPPPGQS